MHQSAYTAAILSILVIAAAPPAAAVTYYVDNQSPNCSRNGAGTESEPYCTIGDAVASRGGPGVEIVVKPGVYREQVTMVSGSAAAQLVVRAQGPGVVVTGADDLSGAGRWSLVTGTVYVTGDVSWSPLQVFVDGMRLVPAPAGTDPANLGVGSFLYTPGQGLAVNLDGPNPGTRAIEVGRRMYGFRLSNKSYVTIDGFHVTRTEDKGIYLNKGSANSVIRGCLVDFTRTQGIAISQGSVVLVESNVVTDAQDHGIYLSSGTTNCTVQGNESTRHAFPHVRAANGIHLTGSPGNLIQRNRCHHNQDSGIQIQSAAHNNLSIQNVSWRNGDHGFDHLYVENTIDIGNVAYGNYKDGFSVEGTSPGTQLYNCIAVDNGIAVAPADGPLEFDLWVSSASAAGFVSDHNIFWNSTGQYPFKFLNTRYATLAAYSAASGQDVHSLQVDPRFVDPEAGDFRLQPGSPAIDSGTSDAPSWPALDAESFPRVDDPSVPNTGSGTPSFADRGAHEYQASHLVPTASLSVSPASGVAPLAVTADGSASFDSDGAIVSYRFDFGDGTVVGPQSEPTATHTYEIGSWTVTLQVTDDVGNRNVATRTVAAWPVNQAPDGSIEQPAANPTIAAGQSVSFMATGADPDGNMPLQFSWDFGGGATNVTSEDPGPVIFPNPGVFEVTLTVRDANDLADPTPSTLTVTVTPAPTGTAADEIHWTITGTQSVSFDWRGFGNTIRYGTTIDYGNTVIAVTPSPLPFSSPGPFWEAKLTGLEENTLYHYSIDGGPDHTFRTPPPRGSSGFKVYAQGDIGDTGHWPNVGVIQNAIASDLPAFTLMLGDLTYGNSVGQAAVDQHFNDMMVWSQDAAYMPAWGNHEWESTDDFRNYRGRFDLPNPRATPSAPGQGGEDWYWFDYGNVRFIAYPEPFPGAWTDWRAHADTLMDQAQADTDIRYIVTFGHRPAYSSGYHQGETSLKNHLDALGESHSKYVLNLNGHSHNYERSHPQHGVIHVTAGTGGSELEVLPGPCAWNACPPPPWSAYRAMHHVTFRLFFNPEGIRGEAICGPPESGNDIVCSPGTILDSFEIGIAGNVDRAPVVTAPVAVEGSEGAALSVPVTASDPDGEPITALTASGLPAGAVFTAASDKQSGTLQWTPGFVQAGSYTVTFTATNSVAGIATTILTVLPIDQAPVLTAPSTAQGPAGTAMVVHVTAVDADGEPIGSLVAEGLPSGATFTPNPDNTAGTLTWTPGLADEGVVSVTFTAANALLGSATTEITVLPPSRIPTPVLAVTPVTGNELLPVTLDGSGSTDPFGSIVWYSFDFGDGATTGPQAEAIATHTYPAGTYTLGLSVANDHGDTAATSVTIVVAQRITGMNLIVNPSFETNLERWNAYANADTEWASGGFDGGRSCRITAHTGSVFTFGLNDSPNVLNPSAAGAQYQFRAWVRSSTSTGAARLQIREYQGNVPIGPQVRSNPVTLSPTWQLLTLDYTTMSGGSTIDFQIIDVPKVPAESFEVDNVSIHSLSSTVDVGDLPTRLEPIQPVLHPSPVRSRASLTFLTTRAGPLEVTLFDLNGRRVRDLMSSPSAAAGVHRIALDVGSERLPSGLYFFRIHAAEGSATGRFVVAR